MKEKKNVLLKMLTKEKKRELFKGMGLTEKVKL